MLSQDHSGAVLRTDCREVKGKSRGPTRKLLRSPDRIWRWLDHSGGGQGGEKGLISGYISKVEPTVFAKRSDRGCEKEGGVKGDSTYFGLSNWNDGIA